jgi:hypothetical protein
MDILAVFAVPIPFLLDYSAVALRFLATQNAAYNQPRLTAKWGRSSLDTHAEAYYPVYQYNYS